MLWGLLGFACSCEASANTVFHFERVGEEEVHCSCGASQNIALEFARTCLPSAEHRSCRARADALFTEQRAITTLIASSRPTLETLCRLTYSQHITSTIANAFYDDYLRAVAQQLYARLT